MNDEFGPVDLGDSRYSRESPWDEQGAPPATPSALGKWSLGLGAAAFALCCFLVPFNSSSTADLDGASSAFAAGYHASKAMIACLPMLVALVGFVLGVVALFREKRSKLSIAGTAVNGVFLALMVVGMVLALLAFSAN